MKVAEQKMLKVPKLRFREFEDGWKQVKLEQVCSRIGDGIHSTPIYDDTGEYSFVNGNNLLNGRLEIFEGTKRVSAEEYSKHLRPINDGTILMSINGTIGNLAYYRGERVVLGKSACFINLKLNVTKDFIYNLLQLSGTQRFFALELTGSTIKNLSLNTIKNTPLFLPTLPEQQKIASFLSAVDERLGHLARKKQLLQQYKKGVMQQLFSLQLRFKREDGSEYDDWEEKRLGELSSLVTKGTTPTSVGYSFQSDGINFIKAENISDDFYIDIESTPKVSDECNQALIRSELKENDILFSIAGTLGRTAIVSKKDLPANTNQALAIVRLKDLRTVRFINYTLNSYSIVKRISQLLTVGAQPNLSLEQVKAFRMQLPCIEEQQKIADFLSSLDKKIDAVSAQIELTQQFKKGLLQELFV